MWTFLRSEVAERFAAVETFFKATRGLGAPVEQTAKGLAFVHLYAAYEYAVRGVVSTAVDAIASHGHKTRELLPSLMALFLDPELTGLKDCPKKTLWKHRIGLFENCSLTRPPRFTTRFSRTMVPITGRGNYGQFSKFLQ